MGNTESTTETTRPKTTIRSYTKQYINGEFILSSNTETSIDVICPNTAKVIATVPRGTEDDTKKAIAAAKAALPEWKNETSVETRIKYIEKILKVFEKYREEIVERTVAELGCTVQFANDVQANAFVGHTKTLVDLLSTEGEFQWEVPAGKITVVKEPIGVVGCITPWNYPLNQIAAKIIPALAAGCTVVLKPSEVTPLVAYTVAQILHECQLPPGVFNMVVGIGPECGEILAKHPDVNLVSFTGSTRAGQVLTKVAADKADKPVKTELGGKSAVLLLDDMTDENYEKIVPSFVNQVMSNSGQSCNALTRMIVPKVHSDKVVSIVAKTMKKQVVGDTRDNDPRVTMGPIVSEAQYDRVISLIEKGIEEGATLVLGGVTKPDYLEDSSGYYVKPTLFRNVTNDMTIAQTEIFGPVLSVIEYDTLENGIDIANDTMYGLNNAVASSDLKKALQVASKLESGCVMVNSTDMDIRAPFGGYKMSGNAREWGIYGLEEFLQTKTINVEYDVYKKLMYGNDDDDDEKNDTNDPPGVVTEE